LHKNEKFEEAAEIGITVVSRCPAKTPNAPESLEFFGSAAVESLAC
jgi:hypothetical protein